MVRFTARPLVERKYTYIKGETTEKFAIVIQAKCEAAKVLELHYFTPGLTQRNAKN